MAAARSPNASGDTQIDAVADTTDFQLDPSSEETVYDPDIFAKGRVQHETAVKSRQMTSDLSQTADDNEIIDYTHILPEELKYDQFEILILNAESDEHEASSLKEGIENNVIFCSRFELKPVVTLLKDVIPITTGGDLLDDAFKRTIYVMLYVTEEFCKHSQSLFQGHSCLKRALNSHEDQWSIIPVHTSPKNDRKYELPLMLDGLRPLNSFSKSFFDDVKRLLDHKSNVILTRRATLAEKRKKCIDEKREELERLRFFSKMIKNVNVPVRKMQENPPESRSKVQVPVCESQSRGSEIAEEQGTDFNHRSSQQKSKNPVTLKQQQQQMNPLVYPETSCGKKSYLRPKSSETITTDSPSELDEKSSEKDISHKYSKQMGLPSDCNNGYSGTVKSPIATYSSLPEPAGDKALPQNLATAESYGSHIGSHSNFPTGQRNRSPHTSMGGILSEDGSNPDSDASGQRVSSNTVPNIPVMPPGNSVRGSPNNPGHQVPRNRNSRSRLSENTSTISGSQIHIHIHQATNVAIGKYSQINLDPLHSRNEDDADSEDSEDSENGLSFEI